MAKTKQVIPNFKLAKYTMSGIDKYDNNILIKALPPIVKKEA